MIATAELRVADVYFACYSFTNILLFMNEIFVNLGEYENSATRRIIWESWLRLMENFYCHKNISFLNSMLKYKYLRQLNLTIFLLT